jgi:para-nitrobenzyl esterase
MIRKLLAAAAVATVALSPAAFAQEAKYSTAKQTIGELVKNEKTKAVLVKHIPDLVANPQLEQGYEMKFADIVQYVPDQLTEEKLKAIDADLAKVTD